MNTYSVDLRNDKGWNLTVAMIADTPSDARERAEQFANVETEHREYGPWKAIGERRIPK